jgi:hypothetical protein
MKHSYWITFAIAAAAGFYLGNARTGTGIYASFIGNTAANVYSSGASHGTPSFQTPTPVAAS